MECLEIFDIESLYSVIKAIDCCDNLGSWLIVFRKSYFCL